MKKIIILSVLLVFSGFLLTAQQTQDELPVDFNYTVDLLYRMANSGDDTWLNSDKVFVLDGAVNLVQILENSQDSFTALVELVTGSWQGSEDVILNKAFILFQGLQWSPRLPARPPREPSDEMILVNEKLLVLCTPLTVTTDVDGNLVPVLQGVAVREVQ